MLPAWEEKQATVGNTRGLGLSPIPVLTYACKGGADPQEGDLRGLAQGGREHAGWQGSPSPWSYLYLHGHHAPGRSLVAGGPGAGFPPSAPEGDSRPPPPQQSFSKHLLSRTSPSRLQLASVCPNLVSPAIDLSLTPTRGPGKRLH